MNTGRFWQNSSLPSIGGQSVFPVIYLYTAGSECFSSYLPLHRGVRVCFQLSTFTPRGQSVLPVIYLYTEGSEYVSSYLPLHRGIRVCFQLSTFTPRHDAQNIFLPQPRRVTPILSCPAVHLYSVSWTRVADDVAVRSHCL